MSAIPLRDYVVTGMVDVATVNELLALGEPMLTDTRDMGDVFPYRAWLRERNGGRTIGRPAPTARLAAENLLAKVRG